MFPPVFATAAASPAVTALLGSNPVRLYLFGEAPQNVTKPYAVWQTVSGFPYNKLHDVPGADHYTLQIDAYALNASSARAVAEALRDAIEPTAYVVIWRGESKDVATGNYRYSFDVDWTLNRGPSEPIETIIDGGEPDTQFSMELDGGGP